MDGWITIGTKLSTDKFDKQIADLEKKMKKEEDKKILIEAKIDSQTTEFQDAIAETDRYAEALERVKKLKRQIEQHKATPEQFSEYQGLTNTYGSIEKITESFDKALLKQQKAEQQLQKTRMEYDAINGKVAEYKQKIEGIKLQKHQKDLQDMKKSVDGVGNSFQKTIEKVGKLALGIFGIRSAYMMLRQASSQLAQYDQQYATDIEYIRYVLTQAIAPVLKNIIHYVMLGMQYVNMLLNGLFGINLFANGSAEAFNRMKKGASGVSSAVKEIKKDLLGFDEINRLTGNDGGVTAGASGVGMPSLDISDTQAEVPEWIKWIVDHKNIVLDVLATIAGLIAGIKIVEFIASIKSMFGLLAGLSNLQIFGILSGVAVTILGIIKTIKSLIKFIKDPSWKNFVDVLNGIAIALTGVGIAMVAFNASNPVGWILLAIGAIGTIITALGKQERQIEKTKTAQERLNEVMSKSKEVTDKYVQAVDEAEEAKRRLQEAERISKITGEELYKAVENGTLDYKNMTDAQKETYKAYQDVLRTQENLTEVTKEYTKQKHDEKTASLDVSAEITKETKKYEDLKAKVMDAFEKGQISAREARNYFRYAMTDMSKDAQQAFVQDLPDSIRKGLNINNYSGDMNRFTRDWNGFVNGLNRNVRLTFEGKIASGASYALSTILGRAKGGVFYPNMLPKLAVGGIVNMPGRGVAYNGAIIGERGAEAVVPLTDTQQMELLGATIGKYITVNANIVNTMNGRVISRELKQVQSEQDFAYNT